MRYFIMNRQSARRASYEKTGPDTAIISITDTQAPLNGFDKQPWIKGVLQVQFEDVEEGYANGITQSHANSIARFVHRMKGQVEQFIVHCEYGISRSSGTAAAIMKYLDGDDSEIWDDPGYSPNRLCYRMIFRALCDME